MSCQERSFPRCPVVSCLVLQSHGLLLTSGWLLRKSLCRYFRSYSYALLPQQGQDQRYGRSKLGFPKVLYCKLHNSNPVWCLHFVFRSDISVQYLRNLRLETFLSLGFRGARSDFVARLHKRAEVQSTYFSVHLQNADPRKCAEASGFTVSGASKFHGSLMGWPACCSLAPPPLPAVQDSIIAMSPTC